MSLDGIRYIFQIPLAWFKRVGEFVFNTYGGNLIQIRRDRNGAAEIYVDPDELKSQISGKFVTLDTAQTITESKTFQRNKGVIFLDGAGNAFTLRGYGGTGTGMVLYIGGSTDNKAFSVTGTTLMLGGGAIAAVGITVEPTDTIATNSQQVASRGWVNLHFFRPATNQTGCVYNTNGVITYKALPEEVSPYTSTPADLTPNGSAGSSARYSRGDHSHPLPDITDLKCTISGHENTCFIIVMNDGTVDHSGNELYNNTKAVSDGYQVGLLTISDHSPNASANKTQVRNGSVELFHPTPYIDFHFANDTSDYTSRIIESASGQLNLVSPNHATLSVHPTATDAGTSDTGATSRQIVTCGWVNAKMAAGAPTTSTSIAPSGDAADNTTWTAGGENGLSKKVLYRTKYVTSGSTPILFGYYRTEVYDKFGRLYSVSGETREVIDSTILITLT